jgi:hypothetical protein
MRVLYANGDSWTFGQEIPSTHPTSQCHTDQYYGSWPFKLASLLGAACVNEGAGAGSNDRIFRKTTEYINEWVATCRNPQDLTIVVGWTTPERAELEANGVYTRININNIITKYGEDADYERQQLEEYRDSYYRVLDLEMAAVRQIRYMMTLRTLTAALGIRYWDFQAIGAHPHQLQALANRHYGHTMDNYYGTTWHNYCQLHGQPLHTHGHPTTEAHHHWASLLHDWISHE